MLDTNVFVSGLLTRTTAPAQLIDSWRAGTLVLVTSPQILTEYREVLLRPSITKLYGLAKADIDQLIADLSRKSFLTKGDYEVEKVHADPTDNKFLACALEGYATHLVTSDKQHLLPLKEYHGVRIVTPNDFVKYDLSA